MKCKTCSTKMKKQTHISILTVNLYTCVCGERMFGVIYGDTSISKHGARLLHKEYYKNEDQMRSENALLLLDVKDHFGL